MDINLFTQESLETLCIACDINAVLDEEGVDSVCPFCGKGDLYVSRNNKYYLCEYCNESGNSIDFITNLKKISFTEAVQYLAKLFNCKMDFYKIKANKE